MIDHIKLFVEDLDRSRSLYLSALEPLGYAPLIKLGRLGLALGREHPELWLAQTAAGTSPTSAHIALRADSRVAVDAFHAAALAAGAVDNGPPGLRAHYHPAYYGAFVLDHDGNNLEAVYHHGAG